MQLGAEKYGGRCVYCGDQQIVIHNTIGGVCNACTPLKNHTIETYKTYLNDIKPMLKGIGLSLIGAVNFFYESYEIKQEFKKVLDRNDIEDATHWNVTLNQKFIVNPSNKDDWHCFDSVKKSWYPTHSMRGNLSIHSLIKEPISDCRE